MIGLAVTVLALLPAVMIAINLALFRRPSAPGARHAVSIIVPVRNEEASIGDCLRAVLASSNIDLEVIVVDDHSDDGTAAIVSAFNDPRLRLHSAPPLPSGWSGKQHACHAGALQATNRFLLFLDCDVRLAPGAAAAMVGYLAKSGAALASGFPRERTGSFGEVLLIPLIHVLLLGYLPIWAMRRSAQVGLGAGCGQIMLADAAIYRRIGGHTLIKRSWHDGVQLPRAFRRAGYMTDIFDASALAECRMYHGFAETWRGLSKNAKEGMATWKALPVWTVLLGGGLLLPFLLLPFGWWLGPVALLAARLALALRFRQSLWSVILMPIGVLLLLVLQWQALLRQRSKSAVIWRGRTQVSG